MRLAARLDDQYQGRDALTAEVVLSGGRRLDVDHELRKRRRAAQGHRAGLGGAAFRRQCGGQCTPDADELADVRKKALDHRDLSRPPIAGADRVAQRPCDVRAAREPAQANVHPLLAGGPLQKVVVGKRTLPLLLGVQINHRRHLVVGHYSATVDPLIRPVVVLQIVALQFYLAFARA